MERWSVGGGDAGFMRKEQRDEKRRGGVKETAVLCRSDL